MTIRAESWNYDRTCYWPCLSATIKKYLPSLGWGGSEYFGLTKKEKTETIHTHLFLWRGIKAGCLATGK